MASRDQQPPTVTAGDSTVVGLARPASDKYPKAVESFYGLVYARAERFKPSVAVPLASGRTDASKPGPPVPHPMSQGQRLDENTLRLNITRPKRDGDGQGLVPVVVYFHGGGFNFGDPLDRDMASFVSHSEGDVLMVSVAYRLGALGFCAVEGEANLGLRDQRVAVEWVREWARVFGGDGEDVTLMGVSAGAHSVGHHMLNPEPVPFRKAILESGSPTARSVLSASHPRTEAQRKSFRDGLGLGQKSLDAVLQASLNAWIKDMNTLCWPFQPVIDGSGGTIPDLPLKLWQQQKKGPAAVLTGFCAHEGAEFIPKPTPSFRNLFTTLIPNIDIDALEALYPPANYPEGKDGQLQRLYEAYGDYAYKCPVLHTAHMLSKAGRKVYLYEFAALSSEALKTASHCSHADFVTKSVMSRPGLAAISKAMHERWSAFVTSPDGDLGDGDFDLWPAFKTPFAEEAGSGELLVFGEGNDEAVGGSGRGIAVKKRSVTEREKEVCRFWWDRLELSQGMGEKGVIENAW